MRELALYYPFFHVRDDSWLKAAALYWPKVGRVVPTGWPRYDSDVARELNDELGFLVRVDPAPRAPAVAQEFRELLERAEKALREKFAIPTWASSSWPGGGTSSEFADSPLNQIEENYRQLEGTVAASWGAREALRFSAYGRLAWVHLDQVTLELAQDFVDAGIAVMDRRLGEGGDVWVGMRPELATIYTTALADRIAAANDMSTVTDQSTAYAALNGWTVDTLIQLLFDDEAEPVASRSADDVARAYALVAIETVVPANLAQVSVKRIVKARQELASEFYAFHDHIHSLSDQFADLGKVEDPGVLRARLEVLVDRHLRLPTVALNRELRRLRLQPATALLSGKSAALPPLAASAVAAAGVAPVIGQAGAAAAQLVASGIAARDATRSLQLTAPGYLLGIRKHLTARSLIERISGRRRLSDWPAH